MAENNLSLKEDQSELIVKAAGMEIRADVDQPGKFLYFDEKHGDGSDISFDSRGEALLACASDVVLYVKHAIGLDDDTWEPLSIEAKIAMVRAVVKGVRAI